MRVFIFSYTWVEKDLQLLSFFIDLIFQLETYHYKADSFTTWSEKKKKKKNEAQEPGFFYLIKHFTSRVVIFSVYDDTLSDVSTSGITCGTLRLLQLLN